MKYVAIALLLLLIPASTSANHVLVDRPGDSDHDGLLDTEEATYGTSSLNPDTDGDTFTDGNEVTHGYNPLVPGDARLPKRIDVDLSEQRLRFYYGELGEQGSFLISSGQKKTPSPVGTFTIRRKLPVARYTGVDYGRRYDYRNTKWNLEFLPSYYIHGAYWHNNFGHPMSHGCINVSYANMAKLYAWADVGTVVTVHQ